MYASFQGYNLMYTGIYSAVSWENCAHQRYTTPYLAVVIVQNKLKTTIKYNCSYLAELLASTTSSSLRKCYIIVVTRALVFYLICTPEAQGL